MKQRLRIPRLSLTKIVRVGWVGFCLLFVAACHFDMYDQAKYKPYGQSDFFSDGAASRPLEPNTVSRTQLRSNELANGKTGDTFVADVPVPVTDQLLARGKERYNIFCVPCHGALANGKGAVASYFNPHPASMYIPRLKDGPAGYIYDVILHGKGQMFSYASRIPVDDRWAIVAYVRDLQQNPPDGLKPEDLVEQPVGTPQPTPGS